MEWPCLSAHAEGVALSVKAAPKAARTEPAGLWEGRLKVRIKAPPVEGKANEALRRWAAELFGLRLQEVRILQGEKGSKKLLLLRGLALDSARASLDAAAAPPPDTH